MPTNLSIGCAPRLAFTLLSAFARSSAGSIRTTYSAATRMSPRLPAPSELFPCPQWATWLVQTKGAILTLGVFRSPRLGGLLIALLKSLRPYETTGASVWPAALILWGRGSRSSAHSDHCIQVYLALSGRIRARSG